ncbi:hypothetical protein CR513_46659, partial [Mucuna pruriens]
MIPEDRKGHPRLDNHIKKVSAIIFWMDLPIKQVLRKPNLARRIVGWTVQLSEFNISFEKRDHIKAQALADFIIELALEWFLSVDGALNRIGSGVGVILEGPNGILIEQSLHFEFRANNKQAEYKALLARMKLAGELGVRILTAKSDSKPVLGQVNGDYQARDPQLVKYWDKATKLATTFKKFTLLNKNERVNLLSKLASTQRSKNNRSIINEKISRPTVKEPSICYVEMEGTWMSPLLEYFKKNIIPEDLEASKRLRQEASKYTLIGQHIYKRGFSFPLLRCLDTKEVEYMLREGVQIPYRMSSIGKQDRQSLILLADIIRCQQFADICKAPPESLHSVMSPWPFHKWDIDMLGPFPMATGKVKYLIIVVDYFKKWIEVESIATISAEGQMFLLEEADMSFWIPSHHNLGQRDSIRISIVIDLSRTSPYEWTSVEHPHMNEQAESFNKRITKKIGGSQREMGRGAPTSVMVISYHTPLYNIRNPILNEDEIQTNLDLLQEVPEVAHIKEYTTKARATRWYNKKMSSQRFKNGDTNKLTPNWEGPFRIIEEVGKGAYRLEHLYKRKIPHILNMVSLCLYYS